MEAAPLGISIAAAVVHALVQDRPTVIGIIDLELGLDVMMRTGLEIGALVETAQALASVHQARSRSPPPLNLRKMSVIEELFSCNS